MSRGRKLLFFLGAGASYGAGATAYVEGGGRLPIPTQVDFWETFLRFCKGQQRRKKIESFLFRYFTDYAGIPSKPTKPTQRRKLLKHIDVEEVFTFLSERRIAPSTSPQLRAYTQEVWDALIAEVGNVFRRFAPNSRTRHIFRNLVKNHVRGHDAIVSFNYDTVFEESLQRKFAWAYEGIQDTTHCLPILKPHGSINWEKTNGNVVRSPGAPDRCVVIAPTHLKFIAGQSNTVPTTQYAGYLDQAPQIEKIWTAMEQEMRLARALIFIGYSFPVADLYFSSLLRSVLAARRNAPDIVLVNPDAVGLAQRLSHRFSVRQPLRYFDMRQYVTTRRRDVLAQLD